MSQNAITALGKRIKAFREAKGWTQARLAETLGCEPMTVSRYERGSYAPSIEALQEIALALGHPLESFFNDLLKPIPAPPEPDSQELRHSLCDIAYRTEDPETLKEIVASARKILSRREKNRT
ncbi:helix-turn-helix domain-containing protein [Stutzerimonas kirkiae]|uniref:XRE family transcriptional regulator n=1 Tax=Stutzerimonas kirkiae TaxID=2211392 RepID=A0A4Q9R3L7_9GAMM|nr:helix-turn-helix transcriptional regulator [Stutzerimonas kirkiae]TBU94574.1 XRE family transcriptional regulator [Stutzerimonas kirkiae]TBV00740.1 XRE family transcriptional regulator [Stutzerimonas kirkiae]TBV04337.1 XRE family transcriptional regulator [Stutzerimonas kirkiae]TBV12730.1 XRE family transcriptional regulator [Stutzerimonas kirkiae]